MTVTTAIKGRYKIYTSNQSTTATIISDLVTSLNADWMSARRVIYLNVTDKIAIAEVGR